MDASGSARASGGKAKRRKRSRGGDSAGSPLTITVVSGGRPCNSLTTYVDRIVQASGESGQRPRRVVLEARLNAMNKAISASEIAARKLEGAFEKTSELVFPDKRLMGLGKSGARDPAAEQEPPLLRITLSPVDLAKEAMGDPGGT